MTHLDFRNRVLRELSDQPRSTTDLSLRIASNISLMEHLILNREVALACDLLVLRGHARKTSGQHYATISSAGMRHRQRPLRTGTRMLKTLQIAAAIALSGCATESQRIESYYGPSGLPFPLYAKFEQFSEQESLVFRYCTDDCPGPTKKITAKNAWAPVSEDRSLVQKMASATPTLRSAEPSELITPPKSPVTEVLIPVSNHQVTMASIATARPAPVLPSATKKLKPAATQAKLVAAAPVSIQNGPAVFAANNDCNSAAQNSVCALRTDIADARINSFAPLPTVQTINNIAPEVVRLTKPDLANDETNLAIARTALTEWAALWSKKDIEAYFNLYDPKFKPQDNLKAKEWRDRRAHVIQLAKIIAVDVDIDSVRVQNGILTVQFWQRYSSNTFKSRVLKGMDLVRNGDRWQIRAERRILAKGMA